MRTSSPTTEASGKLIQENMGKLKLTSQASGQGNNFEKRGSLGCYSSAHRQQLVVRGEQGENGKEAGEEIEVKSGWEHRGR